MSQNNISTRETSSRESDKKLIASNLAAAKKSHELFHRYRIIFVGTKNVVGVSWKDEAKISPNYPNKNFLRYGQNDPRFASRSSNRNKAVVSLIKFHPVIFFYSLVAQIDKKQKQTW